MKPDREELLRRAREHLDKLGGDELRVVEFMLRRIADEGRARYGPLDLQSDRRDFKREAFEEWADGWFYLGVDAFQREDDHE